MIDIDAIRAIDIHVHVQVDDSGHDGASPAQREAMERYFGTSEPPLTVDQTAQYYRERRMAAVVFTVDATTNTGHPPNSIDDIAAGAERNSDVLIPFGSVDPLQGVAAIAELHRQAGDLGVRGFKFHPTVQGFDPSAPEFTPLFAAIEELGLPIISHTGQTGIGAGVPGGLGFRLALSNPMLLDELAARHPGLRIIMAHPSVPWQDEAISIATHKANVWIDLSGWSPKYFRPELVQATRTFLRRKMLFGSDFPALTPERWVKDFAALDIPEEVEQLVLLRNAAEFLGLET